MLNAISKDLRQGSTHTSGLDLRSLGGMFLCVVAFLGFRSLTSLSTASGVILSDNERNRHFDSDL